MMDKDYLKPTNKYAGVTNRYLPPKVKEGKK